MYGSHDSFTNYPVRKWWMQLFYPFSKTQRLDIQEQILVGTRVFDIRVRLKKEKKDNITKITFIPCHGMCEYKVDFEKELKLIEDSGCAYRIILENKIGGKKINKNDIEILKDFFLTEAHPNCIYVADKKNWKVTFNPYYQLKFSGEKNCHKEFKGICIPIPQLYYDKCKYISNKYRDSLQLSGTITWYDFVDVKF